MTTARSALIAGLAGLVVVLLLAAILGLPQEDLVQVVVIAGTAALVAGLLGAASLRVLRGRSFTAQVVVVALTSTATVSAGALAGGSAMFFSAHDLQVLAVVVAVGAVVSVVAALLLGQRVGAASRALAHVVRGLSGVDKVDDTDIEAGMPEELIAEFSRMAEQLRQTRDDLEQSRQRERAIDHARRELVSWVSHDLRTPLAGIRAITELLEDDMVTDREEIRHYYATMRRESDRLSGLVEDLFEVSRIEAGALSIDYTDVDLAELITDTLAAAIPVAEQRDITVYSRLDDDAAVIRAGKPELARVLRNLVSNAVRESVDGGSVLVEAGRETTSEGEQGYLKVEDTCGGIPPEVITRVFEPSFRGTSARTPHPVGGGGLGLAIARGLVEAHGGRITVENIRTGEEGRGCRFTVTLPAQPMGQTLPDAAENLLE